MRWSDRTLAGLLSEGQDQTIAISDHELTLPVNPVFGAVEDIGTASGELLCQRVNPSHTEVGVIGALSPCRANSGLIGAVEKYLHLVSSHN